MTRSDTVVVTVEAGAGLVVEAGHREGASVSFGQNSGFGAGGPL
jgi:hypothetical protein